MELTELNYIGEWDVVRNIPELQDGVGTLGDAYIIYQQPPVFKGYFIYDRDLGSGVRSFPALYYVYYDGAVWQVLGSAGLGPVVYSSDYTSSLLLMGG